MEREKLELVLKYSQKKVILKSYLTENENRELIKALSSNEIELKDGKADTTKTTTDEILAYKDAVINSWVIEFDGSSENINDRLKELRREDYEEVLKFVRELGEEEQKKTN